jgi:hypothetical protein
MTKMVPSRLLEEIARGSHEERLQTALKAVQEHYADFSARSPEGAHLISTFTHHVVVANEDGDFFRASTTDHDDGSMSFVKVESFDVPIIRSRGEQEVFLEQAAKEAVLATRAGDFDAARTQVRSLMKASRLIVAPDPIEETREILDGAFDPDRPWRRVYVENRNHIHRFLWGASGVVYRDAPKPKYADLYEGDEIATPYSAAIRVDLEVLFEKLDQVHIDTLVAQTHFKDNDPMLSGTEIIGMAEQFTGFVEDYVHELTALLNMVKGASLDEDESSSAQRAMIYDKVAAKVPELEIAAKLIQRTANELAG